MRQDLTGDINNPRRKLTDGRREEDAALGRPRGDLHVVDFKAGPVSVCC